MVSCAHSTFWRDKSPTSSRPLNEWRLSENEDVPDSPRIRANEPALMAHWVPRGHSLLVLPNAATNGCSLFESTPAATGRGNRNGRSADDCRGSLRSRIPPECLLWVDRKRRMHALSR